MARLTGVVVIVAALLAPTVARAGIPEERHLWVAQHDGPARGTDWSTAISTSPDGSLVFTTGTSAVTAIGHYGYATVAHAAGTGEELWWAHYDGPLEDRPVDMSVSPDGSLVFVTGYSGVDGEPWPHGWDFATVAYAAETGEQVWAARYDGPAGLTDFASAVQVSPDGSRVYVTGGSWGYTEHGVERIDYATVAYAAATGEQLWAARYEGFHNVALDLAVSPDGAHLYVTGASGVDYATVAYAASSGEQEWVARRDDGRYTPSVAWAVEVSPDGSQLFVTGWTYDRRWDMETIAYEASSGKERWSARYAAGIGAVRVSIFSDDPLTLIGDDWPASMAVSPDGSHVYVTGASQVWVSPTGRDRPLGAVYDFATIAYSAATGEEVWVDRYESPGSDIAQAVAVSPDGSRVFVTGGSESLVGIAAASLSGSAMQYDFLTIAYDASSGGRLWLARRDVSRYDFATAAALSPDGSNIFVTGWAQNADSGRADMTTIAYRTHSCAAGHDDRGPASSLAHEIEGTAGPGGSYVHGVSCELATGKQPSL